MRLSQGHVAQLLDHRDSSTLSGYESGVCMPPLVMAFRLGIILRVPVEFLYPELYNALRAEIREEEEQMSFAGRRRQPDQPETPT